MIYSTDCISKEGTSPVNFVLIIEDTSVVLVPEKSDPVVWPLMSNDGKMRTKVKYQDLSIDFSNRDSVVGNLYKEMMKFDTMVTFDPVSKRESMVVDTIVQLEVVSSCVFGNKGKHGRPN